MFTTKLASRFCVSSSVKNNPKAVHNLSMQLAKVSCMGSPAVLCDRSSRSVAGFTIQLQFIQQCVAGFMVSRVYDTASVHSAVCGRVHGQQG
jgi:hypothetical protein